MGICDLEGMLFLPLQPFWSLQRKRSLQDKCHLVESDPLCHSGSQRDK